jgi:hypothetical protein
MRTRLPDEIDQSGVIAILKTIAELKPKKRRSDAGKPRTPKPVTT